MKKKTSTSIQKTDLEKATTLGNTTEIENNDNNKTICRAEVDTVKKENKRRKKNCVSYDPWKTTDPRRGERNDEEEGATTAKKADDEEP